MKTRYTFQFLKRWIGFYFESFSVPEKSCIMYSDWMLILGFIVVVKQYWNMKCLVAQKDYKRVQFGGKVIINKILNHKLI